MSLLQKSRIKETVFIKRDHNFKEPTHHSHPIARAQGGGGYDVSHVNEAFHTQKCYI